MNTRVKLMCMSNYHAMKAYSENVCKAPPTLKLGSRWRLSGRLLSFGNFIQVKEPSVDTGQEAGRAPGKGKVVHVL
jgi:hypothetical protein